MFKNIEKAKEKVLNEVVHSFEKLLERDLERKDRDESFFKFFESQASEQGGEFHDLLAMLPNRITDHVSGYYMQTPAIYLHDSEPHAFGKEIKKMAFSEDFLHEFSDHLGAPLPGEKKEEFLKGGTTLLKGRLDELLTK